MRDRCLKHLFVAPPAQDVGDDRMKQATTHCCRSGRPLEELLVAFSTRGAPTIAHSSIRFDGILLLAWRITLLGVCAYGFMLGVGG
jgi:hypothetical protein